MVVAKENRQTETSTYPNCDQHCTTLPSPCLKERIIIFPRELSRPAHAAQRQRTGSEMLKSKLNQKTVVLNLTVSGPDHPDCSRISYLCRQVFCCIQTKMLFHSPLLLFPRTILFCYTRPTMPKHRSMTSISLKSHHSSGCERGPECTDTAICCHICMH